MKKDTKKVTKSAFSIAELTGKIPVKNCTSMNKSDLKEVHSIVDKVLRDNYRGIVIVAEANSGKAYVVGGRRCISLAILMDIVASLTTEIALALLTNDNDDVEVVTMKNKKNKVAKKKSSKKVVSKK